MLRADYKILVALSINEPAGKPDRVMDQVQAPAWRLGPFKKFVGKQPGPIAGGSRGSHGTGNNAAVVIAARRDVLLF
jgi:hypothetical protein